MLANSCYPADRVGSSSVKWRSSQSKIPRCAMVRTRMQNNPEDNVMTLHKSRLTSSWILWSPDHIREKEIQQK